MKDKSNDWFGENGYETEVPAGNLLCDRFMDTPGAAGAAAWSIDAISEDTAAKTVELVEMKPEPNHRGLGQLLLYSYLYVRDREVVHSLFEERSSPWETKSGIRKISHHVERGDDGLYYPKPIVETVSLKLSVDELSKRHTYLLSILADLNISCRVDDRQYPYEEYAQTSTNARDEDILKWLETHSKSELDSQSEEKLAVSFLDWLNNFGDCKAFREVPIGGQVFPNEGGNLYADLVIKTETDWLIVEIKNSTTERCTNDFQTAYGQAVGYTSLFKQEWPAQVRSTVPVVVQNRIPAVADCYRQDRYNNDYMDMIVEARKDNTQCVIDGNAVKLGDKN